MRTAPLAQSIELLLRAMYEGTASDEPWVRHNGVAWEMQDLACADGRCDTLPYQGLLFTAASPRVRALTRETAAAVRYAAEAVLTLLDLCEHTISAREDQ